jgi:hypothetical protein
MGLATRRHSAALLHDGAMNTEALQVSLEGPHGERWVAVGGGETLGDALEFAVASAPSDTRWRVVDWTPLYGD